MFSSFHFEDRGGRKMHFDQDCTCAQDGKCIMMHPHGLFLSSKAVHISREHFATFTSEFSSWWQTSRPRFDYFLIYDKLGIYCNKQIVATATSNCIDILDIIPDLLH